MKSIKDYKYRHYDSFSYEFLKNSRFDCDFHNKIQNHGQWQLLSEKYESWRENTAIQQRKIPKKIHQIWLGSKIPKKYNNWRKSWQLHYPDYEYKLWDEKSIIDLGLINERAFIETKNLGAKSDLARYEILFQEGGLYVDTDFESIKRLDDCFFSLSLFAGLVFSSKPCIANGLIACTEKSIFIKKILEEINLPILVDDAMQVLAEVGAYRITDIFFSFEECIKDDFVIFPSNYFYPWPNFYRKEGDKRYSFITDNSYAIHHWEVSWTRKTLYRRIFNWLKRKISKVR